ncbi:hypothetical protein FEA48_30840 [Pseudomonas nitroreducens]|uniref:PLxRFG domain-containing protein n=1 Tax=Pseudomonas nitroreducens TaxID=46680 RepID=A0A5R8ZQ42_PSENT|nr:LPD38 domain-containing protein [Pseudomonas nitroreducens]TLP68252.1 hypothetical protein FEA48_30840 [Pseudomonas nitroreducens]
MANFFDQYDSGEQPQQPPQTSKPDGNFFDQYDGQARHGADEPTLSGEFSKGVSAGIDSLQGTMYGLAGLAGDAVGAEGLRDWGLKGYQRNQDEAAENAPAVGHFEDVHGVRDAGLYAAQGLGQLVPFAASSAATGGVGGAVAKVAGRKAVEKFAENQVAKGVARATAEKAAQAYGNKLVQRGAMAGVAANSIGTEQGSIYGDIYEKTGQYAPGTAAAYGAAAGALDALPEVGLIGRLAGHGTGGIARQAVKQAASEGVTEGAQSAVENLAVQHVDPNQRAFDENGISEIANSAVIGALGGGVAGGGAAAVGRMRKPSEQMGLDPNAGPLSAAATVAVDGRVAHEVQRAALLNNAPAPSSAGLSEQDLADLPTAVAQQMFRTEADPDNPGALRYFRRDPDLQREVVVPEQEALAAAQQRIDAAQQQGMDPLDNRDLADLLPQVDEETGPPAQRPTGMAADDLTPYERNQLRALGVTDEQLASMPTDQARGLPLAQVDFESGPAQVEEVSEQPPLPSVEMDTGPMEAEQVPATPVSGDPDFDFRVQKNGRPFKSEGDVRLRRAVDEATQAGELPVVVPHEGGFAVAVRRKPSPTLALPAPSTMVVDQQGIAQRGATAPWVAPRAQIRPLGGPGMERQAPLLQGNAQQAGVREATRQDSLLQEREVVQDDGVGRNDDDRAAGSAVAVPAGPTDMASVPAVELGAGESAGGRANSGADRAVAEPSAEQSPAVVEPAQIDEQAHQAATSPTNDQPTPTQAQIEAGNYRKGHVRFQGLDISIENPRGSERSGTRPDGSEWRHNMSDHYGYIRRTEGADGEQVDVYLGPDENSQRAFVVDQVNQQDGSFDEHKVMLGYPDRVAAIKAYRSNFDAGWKVGPVTEMPMARFKEWLKDGDLVSPLSEPTVGGKQNEAAQKPAKIEDFGERLAGARKFMSYAQTMSEAEQQDVAAVPLSKSWPEPDYKALLQQGADPWAVSLMRAARDEVPAKPVKAYKLSRWVEQVKTLRGLSLRALVNTRFAQESVEDLRKAYPLLSDMIGRAELYQRFGHERSLKGIGFGKHHYMLYHGEKDVTKWIVSREAKKTAFSNMPRDLAAGDTKEQAMDAFAKVYGSLEQAAAKADAAVRFDIFSERGKPGFYIGKKNGKRVAKIQSFDSLADARSYLRNNQAGLEKQYEALKVAPPSRGEENSPRIGADYRNGQDVTPELFADTFGFRGVQFGNYVENGRRQAELNEAFDALNDLAGILDIPARALSLNGDLGLAFGARGRGGPDPAKAHYEPDLVVINLTKGNGAGSLAHEWWHALDNYLSRARKAPADFVTARPYPRGPGVRPELVQAFSDLMKTIGQTRLRERSEKLDSMRSKDYWSTPEEMSARAFESYVIAKLADQDIRSDYLANIAPERVYNRETTYPYPTAAEIPAVRAAYDNLFQVIETKQDEAGNVALYSRGSYRAGGPVLKGVQASQLQRALQDRIAGWRNAPGVQVVQAIEELPPRLRQQVQRDGAADVEGIFSDGQVYLVADNIGSYQHGGFVLAHEVLGHAGLQGLFGRRLEPLLSSIYRGNDQVRAAADRLAKQTSYRRPVAVEEVLADMAAAGTLQRQGFWQRLVSAIRAGLRAIGLDMRWTDGDLARLLANARGFIEGGAGRAVGEARYSRRGWDAAFPDVTVAHPLAFLNNHPDYAAAKAGDTAAALRVARDAITPEFVDQVRQAVPAGSSPKIVPVLAREGAGDNRIPVIAAEVLAQRLGLQTDLTPVQQEKIGRTQASALERVARQPTFQGDVAPGDYILLDDTLTQGGTLAQLKTHIEDNGGRVVLAAALTGKNYSRKLSLDSSTLAEVRGKYGSIEPWFRETFGYGFEGLTQSEARTILTFDRGVLSPEQLRDRLAASRDAGGRGVGQGATGNRPGAEAPVVDDDQGPRYSRAGQRAITLLYQVTNRGPVQFADHVTAAQQAALEKIGAFAKKETIAETARAYTSRWKEKWVQGVFDQFAPIAKLDHTAYMQARLSKGTDGALESTFLYGKPKLLDGALAVEPDGKGLRGILAGLKGEHDLFFAWMAGHRAERLAAEGRENLFSPEDIRQLKRLNQGVMEGGGSRTLAYAQAQKEFAAYQRSVLDVAEKAGLIDPDARKLWESEFYVPFYRVMEEGDGTAGPGQIGGLTGQRAFQKLKGGKEPLGDLMANTLANWSHLLTVSMKNLAATNALKAAEPMGVATPVREAEKGAVRVMIGGREQHYLVHDPLVLDALTMLHQQDWNNPAMKAMRTFKHWLTTGVTSSPAFRARNLLRDSISAIATNDIGYNPLKNVAEGWRGTAHSNPVMQQLIAGGGAVRFGALNDGDQAAHAKQLIKDLGVKEGQILTTQEKITRALRSAWDKYQELGDRLESVNRAALYKKLREEGKSHLEASYAARDMMDFTSAGKWASVRFLTQIVPFMNARLQGMYKLGRGAGTDPRRFLAVAGAVAMVSVLLHLLNKDDEEYKGLPDFVRNNYWWVRLPGAEHALYIPKPFEVGVLGSVAERMTELATAGSDYRAGDFASTVGALLMDQLSMNPVPQAFKPAMEAAFNYDSFRESAIDSQGQERLPPAERYTSSTSAAAVAAGRLANISPQRLEHLVRGYFGWLGTQALNAGDYMLRGPMDLPANPRRDASNPDNWALYGDFVKPVAGGSSKYMDRFYEMQHQVDQLYASASEARKVDDLDRLQELAGNSTLKLRPIYAAANRRITAINQRMRAVSNDASLGAEEKMALLRELSESRNQVARRVDERARAEN